MYLCLVLFVLFLVFINIHTLCTSADSLEHSLLDTAIKKKQFVGWGLMFVIGWAHRGSTSGFLLLRLS